MFILQKGELIPLDVFSNITGLSIEEIKKIETIYVPNYETLTLEIYDERYTKKNS